MATTPHVMPASTFERIISSFVCVGAAAEPPLHCRGAVPGAAQRFVAVQALGAVP